MLLSQHDIQLLPPPLLELAEPAVGIAVGMRLAILFPGQLQRQVRMALEFFVESRKNPERASDSRRRAVAFLRTEPLPAGDHPSLPVAAKW